jgi:glycosyltransferase involved in cell wall biosynthesis
MKTILLISQADLFGNARLNRLIRAIHPPYALIAVGLVSPYVPGVRFIRVAHRYKGLPGQLLSMGQLLARQYEHYYWRLHITTDLLRQLANVQADLIVAADLETLPVALRVAQQQGIPVLFDAPEYAPQQTGELDRLRRTLMPTYRRYLYKTYVPRVDAMLTASQGIADLYERDLGSKPLVLTNAVDELYKEPLLREPGDPVRVVIYGQVQRAWQLERLLDAARQLDARFELALLLKARRTDEIQYIAELEQRVQGHPHITVQRLQAIQQLVLLDQRYDIGLCWYDPHNANQQAMLPDEFFEYIQCRMALAVSPLPEIARHVRAYGCGVVAEDYAPEALVRCLQHLDHDALNAYKRRTHQIAGMGLAQQNRVLVHQMLERMLSLADGASVK